MRLPEAFSKRMLEMLGEDDFRAYEACLERSVSSALRVNTRKITPERFAEISPFTLRRVPWISNGYYYADTDAPSKHPYYYAGLYYLQEPSAMTPASLLPISEGDRVLDLCAAPGGKSTELAAKLGDTGLLVANDISATRAKALLKNLEVFGAPNILITSESSDKLADRFPGFFDKILVDAPCSGEGMFRKQPAIMRNWEQYGTEYYSKLQHEILPQAIQMLRPGGMLLYSTCTFSALEDEEAVEFVLANYPEMELLPVIPEGREDEYAACGFDTGHQEWMRAPLPEVTKCARLFPHRLEGEGHFVALFRKKDDAYGAGFVSGAADGACSGRKGNRSKANSGNRGAVRTVSGPKTPPAVSDWLSSLAKTPETSAKWDNSELVISGERVCMVPRLMPDVSGLRVLRTGWYLGDYRKERFEPSQACAMGLAASEYPNVCNLEADDPNVIRYLKCETIETDTAVADGFVLVCVNGFPLGFAKAKDGVLKNRYLSGWRML
ncbi:MAG: RsmB/NOP family class I SAM-dependent RNA methyltransferase [Lachnospiraceae bacterium]|nr:RsmB/NOP family class I SAM-dependent RNA methyltransferase [Lachnospiraceae bacterium]